MANERWSISGATRNAGAGKIFLDFPPINNRPSVIHRCQVKQMVLDRLRGSPCGGERAGLRSPEVSPLIPMEGVSPMATDEELKRAYKAFKKRIKLTRLDDESGLSPGSKRSAIRGITPPTGHPPGIWEELVTQGRLKREGSGTYSIVAELG